MAAHEPSAPRLKISRLTIEGFRSLRRVNWPEDGMGWGGEVPDIVLVGGANGSGKTTLLELLYNVVHFAISDPHRDDLRTHALALLPKGAKWVEVSLAGDDATIAVTTQRRDAVSEGGRLWSIWMPDIDSTEDPEFAAVRIPIQIARKAIHQRHASAEGPKLLYFPTDRAVTFPDTRFKGPGNRNLGDGPAFRYEAPKEWIQSVEAILYDARWRDLNAKERGNVGSAKNFAAFEATMQRFFGDTKRFHWDDEGVLHIQTRDGALHPLNALSSGEKQVLLFGAELYRRWTPGSLILLDEPELHLHEAWLAALWALLNDLQRERGGQVILATQSNYLFGLGGAGSRVILGRAP